MQPSADTILTQIITLSHEIIATFGQVEPQPLANDNSQSDTSHSQPNDIKISDKTVQWAENQELKQLPNSFDELANDEFQAEQTIIANIVTQREQLVHQLFSGFNPEVLAVNRQKIATMQTLDQILIDRANERFNQVKAEILALKKSKKAINSYQNR